MHSFLRPFLFFPRFFPFFVVVTFFPLAWKKLVKHAKQINKNMQKRPRQKMNNRKKKATFFANFGFHSSFSILVFLLAVFFFASMSHVLCFLIWFSFFPFWFCFIFRLKEHSSFFRDLAGSGALNTNLELNFDPCIERVHNFVISIYGYWMHI